MTSKKNLIIKKKNLLNNWPFKMAQAARIQQALIAHDREYCITSIPLLYRWKRKDTILPQQLLEWLKVARGAGWEAAANPDQRKSDECFLSLLCNALSWYNTLDNIINEDVWAELKKKILKLTLQNIMPKIFAYASRNCNKSQMRLSRTSTTGSQTPSGMPTRPRSITTGPTRVPNQVWPRKPNVTPSWYKVSIKWSYLCSTQSS